MDRRLIEHDKLRISIYTENIGKLAERYLDSRGIILPSVTENIFGSPRAIGCLILALEEAIIHLNSLKSSKEQADSTTPE